MTKMLYFTLCAVLVICLLPTGGQAADFDTLYPVIGKGISADRAYDYVQRLWQYDKWSTLPMWRKTAAEVRTIMQERAFDEADVVETPADGVTQYETWTNPVGWDVTQATLVVTEPHDVPGEYRYLCSYKYNPTSLTFFSCPTPPEGIEAELVVLDKPDPDALSSFDARGKIILVSSGAGQLKKYLGKNGVLGIVCDQAVKDAPDGNVWLNTWSDSPGGWLMTAADSKDTFCFSISKNKGDYIRNLIAGGKTVRVRATIDSRYYTDNTLPYITGCLRGAGPENEEVLVVGHTYEWGANDNSTGCSIMLESVGALNDLIRSGALPRPRRTIRIWMGQEMYGSLAFAEKNIDRLHRTVAALCCDTPAANLDLTSSTVRVFMNPDVCPTFTDAVLPEFFREYYRLTRSNKLLKIEPFMGGTDTYFCEPMIGIPTNFIYMENGSNLHHTSVDTIDKVDRRSLRDLCTVTALYLYYIANAGSEDVQAIAQLTFDRGLQVIMDKSSDMRNSLERVHGGEELGKALADGVRIIEYYTGQQKAAVAGIERIVPQDIRNCVRDDLAWYTGQLDAYGTLMADQFRETVRKKAKSESVTIVPFRKEKSSWDREAETIIPKRTYFGSITLDGIPVDEWKEVDSSPCWWSTGNWAAASYWWCDGKRNLYEVKECMEIEAGRPVTDFDLITYYRFLERYKIVEFVK